MAIEVRMGKLCYRNDLVFFLKHGVVKYSYTDHSTNYGYQIDNG